MLNEYIKQGLHSKRSSEYISKGDTLVEGNFSIEEPCKNNKSLLTVQNMFWSYYSLKNVESYWNELRYKINEQLTIVAYE